VRTISSPVAIPVRLDYDPATGTLWMTGYGDSRVYNVSLQGRILSSFDAQGYAQNKAIALGGSNDILVASGQPEASPLPLRRYALSGALLEEFPRFGNQWDIASNVNDRGAGFLRPNPAEGDRSASYRIEHYSFGQVFKTVRVHDLQLSFTPAPSGKTPGATPEGRGSNPSGAFERLRVYALFKLGDGSDGIDPATERVSIGIGDWQATLPAGSFVARADGSHAFSGAVEGARAFITISARRDGSYAAFVRMKRPVPARFDNPVQFNLAIGDDHGTTAETVLGTLVTGGERTPAAE